MAANCIYSETKSVGWTGTDYICNHPAHPNNKKNEGAKLGHDYYIKYCGYEGKNCKVFELGGKHAPRAGSATGICPTCGGPIRRG